MQNPFNPRVLKYRHFGATGLGIEVNNFQFGSVAVLLNFKNTDETYIWFSELQDFIHKRVIGYWFQSQKCLVFI